MKKREIKKIEKQSSLFKYLLPSKKREEVLGDLEETREKMLREQFPNWKINLTPFLHKGFVLFSLLRLRITDYGKAKKEVNKNRLQ